MLMLSKRYELTELGYMCPRGYLIHQWWTPQVAEIRIKDFCYDGHTIVKPDFEIINKAYIHARVGVFFAVGKMIACMMSEY